MCFRYSIGFMQAVFVSVCACVGVRQEHLMPVSQEPSTGSLTGTWGSLIRLTCWLASSRDLPVSTSQELGVLMYATVPSFSVWDLVLRPAKESAFPSQVLCS